jgi:hypothetical protein
LSQILRMIKKWLICMINHLLIKTFIKFAAQIRYWQ